MSVPGKGVARVSPITRGQWHDQRVSHCPDTLKDSSLAQVWNVVHVDKCVVAHVV